MKKEQSIIISSFTKYLTNTYRNIKQQNTDYINFSIFHSLMSSQLEMPQKSSIWELHRLENENELLLNELEDFRLKYANLKKQQLVWEQINKHSLLVDERSFECKDSQQLVSIKQQFVALLKEKDHQDLLIKELKQKIEDLKYTVAEMRLLSEKQERIYQKQIQFGDFERKRLQQLLSQSLQSQANNMNYNNFYLNSMSNLHSSSNTPAFVAKTNSKIRQLQQQLESANKKISSMQEERIRNVNQNQTIRQKLQKCSQIAKQMQQYYNNQLQQKQNVILQLEEELKRVNNIIQINSKNLNRQQSEYFQLSNPKKKLTYQLKTNQDCFSLKSRSIVSQYNQIQQIQLQPKNTKNIQHKKTNINCQFSIENKINQLTRNAENLQIEKLSHARDSSSVNEESIAMERIQTIDNSNNCFINTKSQPAHQQSLNLKFSKVSVNDSLSNSNFTRKSELTQSILRQNEKETQIKPRRIVVKTPNKSIQKSTNIIALKSNRNSCSYQRAPLHSSNCEY